MLHLLLLGKVKSIKTWALASQVHKLELMVAHVAFRVIFISVLDLLDC